MFWIPLPDPAACIISGMKCRTTAPATPAIAAVGIEVMQKGGRMARGKAQASTVYTLDLAAQPGLHVLTARPAAIQGQEPWLNS